MAAHNDIVEAGRKLDSDTDLQAMILYLYNKVQTLEKKNTVLHGLWMKTREETEKQTELLREVCKGTLKEFFDNLNQYLDFTEITERVTECIFKDQNNSLLDQKLLALMEKKSDTLIRERIEAEVILEQEESDLEDSSCGESEAGSHQSNLEEPQQQRHQDYQDSIRTLKATQEKIISQMQNFSDSLDSKTLLINKIGLKKTAGDLLNSKNPNIWPVIVHEFCIRGIAFLLDGAMDVQLFKNGSVKIRYGAKFRIRNAMYDLKWFLNNLRKQAKNRFYSAMYALVRRMTYSVLTPSRYQVQRCTLQKIANEHKSKGDWKGFDFFLQRDSSGDKNLFLRGFLKHQPGYVDIHL